MLLGAAPQPSIPCTGRCSILPCCYCQHFDPLSLQVLYLEKLLSLHEQRKNKLKQSMITRTWSETCCSSCGIMRIQTSENTTGVILNLCKLIFSFREVISPSLKTSKSVGHSSKISRATSEATTTIPPLAEALRYCGSEHCPACTAPSARSAHHILQTQYHTLARLMILHARQRFFSNSAGASQLHQASPSL